MRYLSQKWLYLLIIFIFHPVTHGHAAESAQVATSADLVWSEFDGVAHSIWFSSLQQGAWTRAQQITSDTAINIHPQVDTAADGSRLSAWTSITDGHFSLRYSEQKDGVWSEPKTITTQLASSIAPSVLIDNQNNKWIVWAGNNDGLDDIYFSRFVNGKWQLPKRLHPANNVPDILPQLTRDASGRAQVIWQSYHNGSYQSFRSIWDGQAWTAAELEKREAPAATKSNETPKISLPDFVPDPQRAFLRIYVNANNP